MDFNYVATMTVYAWVGLCISIIIVAILHMVAMSWGRWVFRRLKRAYCLSVVWYWLDRFEREGSRTFKRPD